MSDERFMQRALDLAAHGIGHVSTNPMVGCVIVRDGVILGEGYHQSFGGPHAEVNAINSLPVDVSAEGSTVYVTLEPCSHFGKTPPCVDLLIQMKVARVVIASVDPNPMVNGAGVTRLKKEGIQVETDVLGEEERFLNRRFRCYHAEGRPYILLKWAQTRDGFIARTNFDSKWISNSYARQLVHKWRSEEDAILVGANTVRYDNPSLTVRNWAGRNPIRMVMDHTGTIDSDRAVFDLEARTLLFNTSKDDVIGRTECIRLRTLAVEEVLKRSKEMGIQSILVEGGGKILHSFIQEGLWDEARVFEAESVFAAGIPAPTIQQKSDRMETIFGNKLFFYYHDQQG